MNTKSFGPVQIGIVLFTLVTAIIHLALGIPNGLMMFISNGIGYIALVVALYLPQLKQYQGIIRWALIAYTAVTVVAWVFIGSRSMIAYLDKLAEVLLVVLLFVEMRSSSRK